MECLQLLYNMIKSVNMGWKGLEWLAWTADNRFPSYTTYAFLDALLSNISELVPPKKS